MRQNVCILGATGSIGQQTLDILALHPERYKLLAFSAHQSVDKSFEIITKHKPQWVVMTDDTAKIDLQNKVQSANINIEILSKECLPMIASLPEIDTVVAAIVGAAGLEGVLSAAQAGKKIALANKEALVMSGDLLMSLCAQHQAQIFPVDSEHNALFQCMPPGYSVGIRPPGVGKIVLTASGGPFLHTDLETFANITPAQAVKHPNWSMGAKISIDSATMMNKGLEIIEASYLFDLSWQSIETVIHPQSIIHSMVHYVDGSFLAQMGTADMRIPISSALSWPHRITNNAPSLNWQQMQDLSFVPVEDARFPAVNLSYQALKQGESAPCVFNAANEVAVQKFRDGQLRFDQIPLTVEKTLDQYQHHPLETIEQVLDCDQRARQLAHDCFHS